MNNLIPIFQGRRKEYQMTADDKHKASRTAKKKFNQKLFSAVEMISIESSAGLCEVSTKVNSNSVNIATELKR